MLIPNTSISPDSAFYTNDQYATLDEGRTRVRINVKTLPDGSVDAYGFYTGGKTDWENVPVIKAAIRVFEIMRMGSLRVDVRVRE